MRVLADAAFFSEEPGCMAEVNETQSAVGVKSFIGRVSACAL